MAGHRACLGRASQFGLLSLGLPRPLFSSQEIFQRPPDPRGKLVQVSPTLSICEDYKETCL